MGATGHPGVLAFGWQQAWLQLYERKQHLDPFVIIALPVILAGCALLLIAWAEYNRYRFAGRERRNPREDASRSEIARSLGASDQLAEQMFNAKAITLHMDEHARPLGMTAQLLR